ncbi:hypothetical protein ACFVZL_36860 [Streptomyces sp. NPDC058320]|uniref:hypothetical protein n=1 Tax=Streptomyces sp. NPDC058320 TaxID=3346444 RepID=UPI0036ECA3E0
MRDLFGPWFGGAYLDAQVGFHGCCGIGRGSGGQALGDLAGLGGGDQYGHELRRELPAGHLHELLQRQAEGRGEGLLVLPLGGQKSAQDLPGCGVCQPVAERGIGGEIRHRGPFVWWRSGGAV